MLPDALSLDSIARELRTANLAMMGQDPEVDEVQGVLLFRSSMIRLFDAFIKALGGSFMIIVDSQASIELQPASGRIPIAGGVFVGSARAIERLIVSADRPYNLLIGFSNTPVAPQFLSASRFQLRVADITLTKTNVAATPDTLVDVPVVPKSGAKTLVQATYGDAIIPTLGWGKKTFRVDNTGANAAEVQVQGRIDPEGTFVGDLDVEAAGGRTTIAAGDYATLETGLSWSEIRLQAAVAAAEAALDATTLAVSYLGEQPQVR